ncbi:hypothetical protein JCM3774_001058 [Rhodotorula dairenensis]
MSNLIPSTFRTASHSDAAAASSASPARASSPRPGATTPALPQALYTDCQACRITGTVTFSAVGVYALTVARSQAKTTVGKTFAGAAGLGFLAIAAARWTAYTPPPRPPGAVELAGPSPS